MGEASLTFPAICLAFSFLFVIGVYHATIIQRLRSFHRRIILPQYRRITDGILPNHAAASHDEAIYEPVNHDINDDGDGDDGDDEEEGRWKEEEPEGDEDDDDDDDNEEPALPRTPRAPWRSSPFPPANSGTPSRHVSATDEPAIAVSWAREPHSSEGSVSPPRTEDFDGELDIASSDDEEYLVWDFTLEGRIPRDEIPVWEVEAERDFYIVQDRQPRGTEVLLDRTVEWTAQMVYGLVAPDADSYMEEQA
ncbi:hypothetical protein N7461_001532 [Penicillium sp. DV-2018c]|nr:hypothetical protein N7461_001532 [Penicillium sp. DV-2018c]